MSSLSSSTHSHASGQTPPKGFAKVFSAQTLGLDAHIVTVEADVIGGMHVFSIVGLPDKAVEESRDRVSAAIRNSGFLSPKKKNKKITVALAPADLKKEGPAFDLAVALAYMRAVQPDYDPETGKRQGITCGTQGKLFLGELALDGTLRPIQGALRLVQKGRDEGFNEVFIPKANAKEAALIEGIAVYPAETLSQVVGHLTGEGKSIERQSKTAIPTTSSDILDFTYVKGQESAKRGLEIAAAGGHNIAMYGPPGTGKSMLAKAFAGILPQLSFEDMLEVTGIHSIAGILREPLVLMPPFRSPHHTSSYVAIVGGGTYPKPGDITLAHKGVLFLDEFPEFDRRVVEALRQPLEEGVVSISRSKGSAEFPANVILVASMNPCPCGFYGTERACTCLPAQLERYRRKLSGPIVDRIDLWVEVGSVSTDDLLDEKPSGERSEKIRARIERARKIQTKRLKSGGIGTNSDMGVRELGRLVPLSEEIKDALKRASTRHNLSARAHHRIIKLARTIADLEESKEVEVPHLLEALQYRPKQFT